MKRCPRCGRETEEVGKFCSFCGQDLNAPSVRLPSGQSDTRTIPRRPAPKTDKKGKTEKKRASAPEKKTVMAPETPVPEKNIKAPEVSAPEETIKKQAAPAPEKRVHAPDAPAPEKKTVDVPRQTVPAKEDGKAANAPVIGAPSPAEEVPHGKRDRDLEPDKPRYFSAALIGLALAALLALGVGGILLVRRLPRAQRPEPTKASDASAAEAGESALSAESETEPEATTLPPKPVLKLGLLSAGATGKTPEIAKAAFADEDPVLQVYATPDVAADEGCFDLACALASQGCRVVVADDPALEPYLRQAAGQYPNTAFCVYGGVTANNGGVPNFHNFYPRIFEGTYLAGVAAGEILRETSPDAPRLGFVCGQGGAPDISAYTAWFLGVKSVIPDAKMTVRRTDPKDPEAAAAAVGALAKSGAVLIGTNLDNGEVADACEAAALPYTCMGATAEGNCLAAVSVTLQPFFAAAGRAAAGGKPLPADWSGGVAEGVVTLIPGEKAKPGEPTTAEDGEDPDETPAAAPLCAWQKAEADLKAGKLQVFALYAFRIDEKRLFSYHADVIADELGAPDTEAVSDGAFRECVYRSAPYFDLHVDGITVE